MTEREKILELIDDLVWDAFQDGIGCGHPLTRWGEQDKARKEQKERIQEIKELVDKL